MPILLALPSRYSAIKRLFLIAVALAVCAVLLHFVNTTSGLIVILAIASWFASGVIVLIAIMRLALADAGGPPIVPLGRNQFSLMTMLLATGLAAPALGAIRSFLTSRDSRSAELLGLFVMLAILVLVLGLVTLTITFCFVAFTRLIVDAIHGHEVARCSSKSGQLNFDTSTPTRIQDLADQARQRALSPKEQLDIERFQRAGQIATLLDFKARTSGR